MDTLHLKNRSCFLSNFQNATTILWLQKHVYSFVPSCRGGGQGWGGRIKCTVGSCQGCMIEQMEPFAKIIYDFIADV